MLVFGAFRRQKPAFPKLAAFQTHPEAISNPSRTFFHNSGTLFAIFGFAIGQIHWKKAEQIFKNLVCFVFLGPFI